MCSNVQSSILSVYEIFIILYSDVLSIIDSNSCRSSVRKSERRRSSVDANIKKSGFTEGEAGEWSNVLPEILDDMRSTRLSIDGKSLTSEQPVANADASYHGSGSTGGEFPSRSKSDTFAKRRSVGFGDLRMNVNIIATKKSWSTSMPRLGSRRRLWSRPSDAVVSVRLTIWWKTKSWVPFCRRVVGVCAPRRGLSSPHRVYRSIQGLAGEVTLTRWRLRFRSFWPKSVIIMLVLHFWLHFSIGLFLRCQHFLNHFIIFIAGFVDLEFNILYFKFAFVYGEHLMMFLSSRNFDQFSSDDVSSVFVFSSSRCLWSCIDVRIVFGP